MEKRIIKIIESLDKISDSWCNLTLRRTIVSIFTTIIFIQVIITTIWWMFGKTISVEWLGVIGTEFGAWGVISAYYFRSRGKIDEQNNENDNEMDRNSIEENKEINERGE